MTSVLSVTSPAALRVFQRDTRSGGAFGHGTGAVPLTLTLAATVTSLEFQLRDARAPANVLLAWTTAATALTAGTQTLTLMVPAAKAWFIIDLRANGDAATVVSTENAIGVGEVIAAAGQSLATDFWSTAASYDTTTLASLGITPSPFGSALAVWDGAALPAATTAWEVPSDTGTYRSTFAAEFLRLVVAASGVNAALVGCGHSGTDISTYWLPGKADYVRLTSLLATAGGKFGTFIWCQGHNDADARSGTQYHATPFATYRAYLELLFLALGAAFPSIPFGKVLCAIPSIGALGSAKFTSSGIETIRLAHLAFVATDLKATYVGGLDAALASDGIHPSQAGNITFARHMYRATLPLFSPLSVGDRGPVLNAAPSRAAGSATIVLPVQHAGGSRLVAVGDATSQFQVFPAGQTSAALTVAAVDITKPTAIMLTLATAPADNQALDIWYRLPFDQSAAITSGIYDDNVSEGDGLTVGRQLAILPVCLTVPAPSQAWHRPVLVQPGRPMLADSTRAVFVA